MDTPITSSQVPDAVSLVAERKAHYLDKRAKVKGGEEVQVSSSDNTSCGICHQSCGICHRRRIIEKTLPLSRLI